jgi:dihydrofolate reductase
MRDLIVTENITVDGVIDAADGWFAPSGTEDPGDIEELVRVTAEHSAAADALLVGRVTYEEFEGFWPKQTDDVTGVAEYLNGVAKYVVSATMGDPTWQQTTVLRGPVADEVAALKALPGKDIVVTGSVTLVHSLAGTGLIDEYRLFVYPVVLGRGRRLFADGVALPNLRLVESRQFRSGITLLRYRV